MNPKGLQEAEIKHELGSERGWVFIEKESLEPRHLYYIGNINIYIYILNKNNH